MPLSLVRQKQRRPRKDRRREVDRGEQRDEVVHAAEVEHAAEADRDHLRGAEAADEAANRHGRADERVCLDSRAPVLTPRYVNTPSRHCMSRKATTAASPKRLPGASHRLTKPAIRCPQEGEVAAYFPLRQPPCGGAIKSSAAETGAGARDWGWGGG